jgi:hypothetical protein
MVKRRNHLWPEEYIDWARVIKPALGQFLSNLLQRLAKESLVQEAVGDMVAEAARRTFATTERWRRYQELIVDAAQFRRLVFVAGTNEALCLFLEHEYVAARVQKLSPNQRLVVSLRYVGRLSVGDVAPILGVTTVEAGQAINDGLVALCDVL